MTLSACLWLGLFPLLQFGSYRSITGDKWLCMLVLTGITLICFLADALTGRIARPRLYPLLFGAGLLGWTIISCLASPFPGSSWWIGTGRREGLSSRLCYLSLFFLFSASRVRRKPVLASAGCGALAFLAVVLFQRAGGNPFGLYPDGGGYESTPFFQGTVGNVDMCSGYLVILCGLFFPACTGSVRKLLRPSRQDPKEKRKNILFSGVLILALSGTLYLLATVNVASGLLALAVLLIWSAVRLLPRKVRLAVFVLLLAVLVLLVWFWPGQSGPMWEMHEILLGRPQFSFGSGRIGVWTRSMDMLRTEGRLLTGTGADTFAARFNAFLSVWELSRPDAEYLTEYYDSPHCEYLALVSDCGIPALFCFLALIIAGFSGAPAWRDSVLAYSIQALFSFSVCIVAPMFWVVLGLSFRAPPPESANPD